MKNRLEISLFVMLFLLCGALIFNETQGITGFSVNEIDSDLDGIPDSIDKTPFDYDNDGMPDIWERKYGLRYDAKDANEDPDNDGVNNLDEYFQGSDPLVSDEARVKIVEQELFSPFEITLLRVLIWGGIIVFLLLVFWFLVYKVHILRIFRFVHHTSKEHFDEAGVKPGFSPIERSPPRQIRQYPPSYDVQRPVVRERVQQYNQPIMEGKIPENKDIQEKKRKEIFDKLSSF